MEFRIIPYPGRHRFVAKQVLQGRQVREPPHPQYCRPPSRHDPVGDLVDMAAKHPAQFILDLVTALAGIECFHPVTQGCVAGELQVMCEIARALQLAPEHFIGTRTMTRLQTNLDISEAGGHGHKQLICR
jgi:hypothetical protein